MCWQKFAKHQFCQFWYRRFLRWDAYERLERVAKLYEDVRARGLRGDLVAFLREAFRVLQTLRLSIAKSKAKLDSFVGNVWQRC